MMRMKKRRRNVCSLVVYSEYKFLLRLLMLVADEYFGIWLVNGIKYVLNLCLQTNDLLRLYH